MQEIYNPKIIEDFVQKHWDINHTFKVTEDYSKKKYYCLSMLPYPSGHLHMGHVRNYTIGDVISRYQRMLGKNVLQPIGWDAFGLPAEIAAITNNINPSTWTYNNINYMRKQLKILGYAYDWDREIITCEPEYYKWEQWFFINLYNKGLVYKKIATVNWCPQDKTVLANEQVINGCCWRCQSNIIYKNIPQWFIKITKYAEKLLNDLDELNNWPNKIKIMQSNWIGRSPGIEISLKIIEYNKTINIFITKNDQFIDATYIMLSPNHPLSIEISLKNFKLTKFIHTYKTQKILQQNTIFTEQKGINTGLNIIHPITKNKLPIWIVNFLPEQNNMLIKIGIPNHDENDLKFANKYNLPTKSFHTTTSEINKISNFLKKYKNINLNYQEYNNLNNQKKFDVISTILIEQGIAAIKIQYKLQDWCISRQRYWGTPIPMITVNNNIIVPVPSNQLPVILPQNIKINKNISNPLILNKKWIYTKYNGNLAVREVDTFDTFMESSWYYARYTCPKYKLGMLDSNAANYWLPIDQYVGGIEHAVMHLMYFRFYHKLMHDMGLINCNEPAKKLLCQGMVLANSFYYLNNDNKQIWISPEEVSVVRDKTGNITDAYDKSGRKLIFNGMSKMSKSKKNGINPHSIIKKYGSDTLRLFIMFAAPPTIALEWKESGIKGAKRFLDRIWKITFNHIQQGPVDKLNIYNLNDRQQILRKEIHHTIIKVTKDIEQKQMFNTAIAAIMKLINKLYDFHIQNKQDRSIIQEALSVATRLIYPFTPHISFVMWKALGNKISIDHASWPTVDNSAIIENTKTIAIQINGKFRSTIEVPNNNDNYIYEHILQHEKIKKIINMYKIKKTIYIPKKIINFVTY